MRSRVRRAQASIPPRSLTKSLSWTAIVATVRPYPHDRLHAALADFTQSDVVAHGRAYLIDYKVRLPAPDLDIHSVEGLLASHFSVPSHIVPAFSAPSYHHPVSEVDHHYSYIPHQHDYEDERERYFPRPPRAYFGLHPSPQSPGPYAHEFTDARPPMILPALPAGISDRRVYLSTAGEPAHASEVSVGDEYDSTSPISPREGRSSRVSNARSTRSDSPNRSSGPRREASLVVIACRQWYVDVLILVSHDSPPLPP